MGAVWNNFKNETGVATNIGMQQPAKIDGMVTPGVNTGNNSGIFPDNVMAESFGMFPGKSSYLKITGLNLSKTYDFTIFASITGVYNDNTTSYTINGKTCMLNAIENKSGTLTMFNIVPDQNGEVIITFNAMPGATFGLLGALIIKGYDATVPPVAAQVPSAIMVVGGGTEQPVTQLARGAIEEEQQPKLVTAVQAYPNPFDQYITVNVPPAKANDKIRIEMTDMSGHVVYSKQYENLSQGNNVIRVQPGVITKGVYLLRVMYTNAGKQSVINIIKQ
ncbi:MAG: T9SS type A sorting domain-containing protein [Chitinophagaceae bacterium]